MLDLVHQVEVAMGTHSSIPWWPRQFIGVPRRSRFFHSLYWSSLGACGLYTGTLLRHWHVHVHVGETWP